MTIAGQRHGCHFRKPETNYQILIFRFRKAQVILVTIILYDKPEHVWSRYQELSSVVLYRLQQHEWRIIFNNKSEYSKIAFFHAYISSSINQELLTVLLPYNVIRHQLSEKDIGKKEHRAWTTEVEEYKAFGYRLQKD